jgi:hypothetical protein
MLKFFNTYHYCIFKTFQVNEKLRVGIYLERIFFFVLIYLL